MRRNWARSLSCSPPWTSICQRLRDLARPLELPVRARLLERGVAGVLEAASHRDRDVGRVAAVGVGVQLDVRPDRLAHRRDDRFAAPGRGVLVAAAGRAEPDLERLAAERVAQLREPRRLVGRADVAAHARSVGGQRAHLAAEQDRDRLARDLPVEIPQRGVDARQRAAEERPRELQLRVDDVVVDGVDVGDVLADDPPRDQPVQHHRRDVGLVGRDLAPADLAVARRDADQRQRLALEGLDRLHGQAARHDRPVLVAGRPAQVVVRAGAGRSARALGEGTGGREGGGGRGQRGAGGDLFEEAATTGTGHGILSSSRELVAPTPVPQPTLRES